MNKIIDINKRFWGKVEKTETCWNWIASLTELGYGRTSINGKDLRAHRLSWELHNGIIPDGMQINHKCNNPSCVNPEHLYVGTQQENMNDAVQDGRTLRGERNHRSKLREENVVTIKWLLGLGVHQASLAVIYEVSRNAITDINMGRKWSHV